MQIPLLKPANLHKIDGPIVGISSTWQLKNQKFALLLEFHQVKKHYFVMFLFYLILTSYSTMTELLLLLNLMVEVFCKKNLFHYYTNICSGLQSTSFKNPERYSTSPQHQVFPFQAKRHGCYGQLPPLPHSPSRCHRCVGESLRGHSCPLLVLKLCWGCELYKKSPNLVSSICIPNL